MQKIRPAFKCHGGKFYLSRWIISQIPAGYSDLSYVEPFCGGASVLLNKQRSAFEAINDLDPAVYDLYTALRDTPEPFAHGLHAHDYTEKTFRRAQERADRCEAGLDRATNEYILRRMSRGGLRTAFAWSERLRGGKPGDVNAWETALANLPVLSERLQGVDILNRPAVEIVRRFDGPDAFFYCDPPYLPATRVSRSAYAFEMTADDHCELAGVLNGCRGRVLVSGYPSPLYDRLYRHWNRATKEIANHASQKAVKEVKQEVVWMNY
ncbi:MAG: DNA adenine methylase [Gemmataceae bacterium]|nr:DNA adenine methylase [Gemmataceae bacterium]